MASRFWAGSSSEDEDSDYSSDSSVEMTQQTRPTSRWAIDSESESDDEVRVVRSAKDKAFDQLENHCQMLKNHLKINDWSKILAEYDLMMKLLEKQKKVINKQTFPKYYVRTIVQVEDGLNELISDKPAQKKMGKENSKAFIRMKGKLKKSDADLRQQMEAFRANPDQDESEDDSDYDGSDSSSSSDEESDSESESEDESSSDDESEAEKASVASDEPGDEDDDEEADEEEESDQENEENDGIFRKVLYCPIDTLPPEYCEYGPCFDECKTWLLENCPDLHLQKYNRTVAGLIEAEKQIAAGVEGITLEVSGSDKKNKRKLGIKDKKSNPENKNTPVYIEKMQRSKKKSVTLIVGLEGCGDIKLKDAAKKLGKKFACSASVNKLDSGGQQIQLQGDCLHELPDLLVDMFNVDPERIFFLHKGKTEPAF